MARIKRAVNAVKKRRKVFKLSKGYYGAKSKLYRAASQQVMKSMAYAYVGRKLKKREYRKLWIARINAGARICGTNYSNLIHGLKVAGVDVNRKVLADLAISDMNAFNQLVQVANKALNAQVYPFGGINIIHETNIVRGSQGPRIFVLTSEYEDSAPICCFAAESSISSDSF